MNIIDKLAEEHIRKAQENGEFDNLPGMGKALQLDDDSMVPRQLRAGLRLLKNAGYLPRELQLGQEIQQLDTLIVSAVCQEQKQKLTRRQQLLRIQLSLLSPAAAHYFDQG